MSRVRTINALRGALSVESSILQNSGRDKNSLTSLLDHFGTSSLGVVGADNAVQTVLHAKLVSSIADIQIKSTYHIHVELGSKSALVSKFTMAILGIACSR
jgi:hypothetical protein